MQSDKSEKTLIRGLGLFEAATLIIGGMVGTTIFLVTSDVATIVGSPGLVMLTWVVAGLLQGAAALCFAELSASMPHTGGTYVFLNRAYNSELLSFCFAWMMCFAYSSAAIAVVAILAGIFLMPVLQGFGLIEGDYARHIAILLIVFLAILNARGVKQGGIAQNVFTIVKVSLMLVVIVTPLVLIDVQPANFLQSEISNTGLISSSQNVGTALILCLFAYSGAFFVTHVAEEISEPQRNIPKAIMSAFLIVFVLYLLINVTYLTTMPFDDVKASTHIASDVMARALGPTGAILTSFIVFCSAVGVVNAQLLNYPRIPFALAKDGLFFRRIANVSDTRRTPSNAIMLIGTWASLMVLAGSYSEILGFVAFVIHFFISLAVLAVIILRIREPDLVRPYKVWGYPWTPVLFLIVSAGYLINLIVTKPGSVFIGVAIVLAGLPFYWYWKRQMTDPISKNVP